MALFIRLHVRFLEFRLWVGYYCTNNSVDPLNHCEKETSANSRCALTTIVSFGYSELEFSGTFCRTRVKKAWLDVCTNHKINQ